MRQIYSVNQGMEHLDFVKVEMKLDHDGDEYVGEAVIYREYDIFYILQDWVLGRQPNLREASNFGFRYSWASSMTTCLRAIDVEQLRVVPDANIQILSVLQEDGMYAEVERPRIEGMPREFLAKNYELTNKYTGQRGYHCGVVMNQPLKDNYEFRVGIELEVEFNTEDLRDEFNQAPSNWFYRESDGSLGNYGCEIITIPLLPKDAKSANFWKPLTDALQDKATSWDTGRCGLHVHVGREAFGKTAEEQSETIGKLLYLYHHIVKDTAFNTKVYGRDRSYNEHDGKTDEGNAVALLGGEKLLRDKDICKKVGDAMKCRAEDSRYFDINLQNSATVEFRKGRGSINAERIAMVVEYNLMLVKFAKRSPWSGISAMRWRDYVRFNAKSEALKALINEWL